jgi:hypothetical protein
MGKLIIEEYTPPDISELADVTWESTVENAEPLTKERFREAMEVVYERIHRPPELVKMPMGVYKGSFVNDLLGTDEYDDNITYMLYTEVWM